MNRTDRNCLQSTRVAEIEKRGTIPRHSTPKPEAKSLGRLRIDDVGICDYVTFRTRNGPKVSYALLRFRQTLQPLDPAPAHRRRLVPQMRLPPRSNGRPQPCRQAVEVFRRLGNQDDLMSHSGQSLARVSALCEGCGRTRLKKCPKSPGITHGSLLGGSYRNKDEATQMLLRNPSLALLK